MTFQEIVALTPDIATGYEPGLQALRPNNSKVNVSDTRCLGGSVNIDDLCSPLYPQENRWDYAFDYNDEVFFIEVHPANTSEVDVVLSKLNWLKNWLTDRAPLLNNRKSTNNTPFYWLQSGKFAILPNSPQQRRMAQAGLRPIRQLNL